MVADPLSLLRACGIQVTAQRLAVLRAVAGDPHITAERAAERARREIGAVSLQSVYDALNVLVAGPCRFSELAEEPIEMRCPSIASTDWLNRSVASRAPSAGG